MVVDEKPRQRVEVSWSSSPNLFFTAYLLLYTSLNYRSELDEMFELSTITLLDRICG